MQIKDDIKSSDVPIDKTSIKECSATVTKDVVATIVHKTIHDAARRKLDVVISGLPESEEGGTGGDDNRSAFLDLWTVFNLQLIFPQSPWLLLEDAYDSAQGTGTNHVDCAD